VINRCSCVAMRSTLAWTSSRRGHRASDLRNRQKVSSDTVRRPSSAAHRHLASFNGNAETAHLLKGILVMRKVIVVSHISIDGVIQAPGGPEEDTSGGFAYGGWIAPYTDDVVRAAIREQMDMPFELLVGRKTFELWAPFWPQHAEQWPGVNTTTKYVASRTMTSSEWQPTVFLGGEIVDEVVRITQRPGSDLHVYGSGDLLQTLIAHDLVDALWLKIYPVTLGDGKRLFADGTIPAAFKVTESRVSPSGVIIVNYERAGAVTTRAFG